MPLLGSITNACIRTLYVEHERSGKSNQLVPILIISTSVIDIPAVNGATCVLTPIRVGYLRFVWMLFLFFETFLYILAVHRGIKIGDH